MAPDRATLAARLDGVERRLSGLEGVVRRGFESLRKDLHKLTLATAAGFAAEGVAERRGATKRAPGGE